MVYVPNRFTWTVEVFADWLSLISLHNIHVHVFIDKEDLSCEKLNAPAILIFPMYLLRILLRRNIFHNIFYFWFNNSSRTFMSYFQYAVDYLKVFSKKFLCLLFTLISNFSIFLKDSFLREGISVLTLASLLWLFFSREMSHFLLLTFLLHVMISFGSRRRFSAKLFSCVP